MLTVKIICIGKLKEKYWKDAIEEYKKRLTAFCNIQIIELSESFLGNDENLVTKALDQEAQKILAAIGNSYVISLCIEGKQKSSLELANFFHDCAISGKSSIAFVIGSSHGLDEKIKCLGDKMSMSKMTFPHQMARVMVLEQVYRAFSINAGTKYHK